MNPEQLQKIVHDAATQAIDAKLGQFYVDREQHYQDHLWLKSFREWTDSFKNSFLKSLAKGVATIILFLLIFGFIFWGQHHFK